MTTQSNTADAEQSENTAADAARTSNLLLEQAIQMAELANEQLSELEQSDLEAADDETLANARDAFKNLSDTAEDTRKDTVEEEMQERVEEPGESVAHLTLTEGTRRYVTDEDAIISLLSDAGIDPTRAMKVKQSKAREVAEKEGVPDVMMYVGETSYTYFR